MRLIIKMLFICILGCSLLSNGQTSPLPILQTPKSPNVAAMERYGNYEVDLFRGLPKIDIPLFEIKTKNFSVPITLNYHASGIKVTDVASWVGLGWNLSPGGAISRTVRGRPDEETTGMFNHTNPSPIDPTTANGYYLLRGIFENRTDAEPDIFSFNIPNDNGKFVYINNSPVFIPYLPYKLSKAAATQPPYKLTNASGTGFYFGKDGATEGSATQRGATSIGNINAWLLTKMEAADLSDSIIFNYYPNQSLSYPADWEDNVNVIDQVQTGQIQGGATMMPSYTSGTISVSSGVDQKLLQEIIYAGGKIVFELNANGRDDLTNAKSLKRIIIYGKAKSAYKILKTVNFYHSYFLGNNTSRLKLDSLMISSANNEDNEVYRFTYNESSPFPAPNTKSRDFWDYYNGKTNTTLIPGTIVPFSNGYITNGPNGTYRAISIGGANDARIPDTLKAQLGILKRIQFPTGGYAVFNYESNKYSNQGDTLIGGGLRIKSIFSFPSTENTPLVKSYVYGQYTGDQSGVGIINAITAFNYRSLNTDVEEIVLNQAPSLPFGYVKQSWLERYYASNAYGDFNAFDGTNVYYPFVTEYTGTSGNNLSKTTYKYSFSADQIVTNVYDRIPYASSTYWKRGQLLVKEDFKKDIGNQYKLIHAVHYGYEDFNNITYPNAGILVSENVRRIGSFDENLELGKYGHRLPYRFSYYDIYSGALLPSSTTEYTWDADKKIMNENYITYNDKGLISSRKMVSSAEDTLISLIKYPFEYNTSVSSLDEDARGIKLLVDLNILNQPIEEVKGIKSSGGNFLINSGSIKTFYADRPIIKSDYYFEEENSSGTTHTPSIINASGAFTIPSGFEKRLSYSLLDQNNNILEYDKDGYKTAFLWNEKGALITTAENTSYEAIAFTSFEDSVKGNWNYNEANVANDNTLNIDNTVYTLSALNSITKNNIPQGNYIVSYTANAACLVNNASPTKTIPNTSNNWIYFEHFVTLNGSSSITVTSSANTLIDNLRLSPQNAASKSFVYDPYLNISTEIANDNKSVFYTYDGLQKLSNIRDEKGGILKKFTYQIKNYPILSQTLPVFYYNNSTERTYRKNDCSPDENGSYVKYTVPYGSYVSLTSQSDADQKTLGDLDANGQNNANANGSCILKTLVEWKPSGLYCQKRVDVKPPQNPNGYVVSVASSPGSNNYTVVTLTRTQQDADSKSSVQIRVNYLGGNADIDIEMILEKGEVSKQRTVGGSDWLNSNRNGASILSITALPFYTYTQTYVYGTRSKYVGGELVSTESNMIGIGEGPYFNPIPGDFNKCPYDGPFDATTVYTVTGAYANNKYAKDFYKQCTDGGGSRIVYEIPAGKYTSSISQADADQLAINDINANGQAYADAVGTCPVSATP